MPGSQDAAATSPAAATTLTAAGVEALLDELQQESERRRTELREIALQLPAAVSRRAILRSAAGYFWRVPNKREIGSWAWSTVRRGMRRLGRAPRRAVRMLRANVRTNRDANPNANPVSSDR